MNPKDAIRADLDALPAGYKTADLDRLIRRYVKEKRDLSCLRPYVLSEQDLHRVYFHGSLEQIRDPLARLRWLDENLLFSDWRHTDENINYVKDVPVQTALSFARRYVADENPYIRRWGYVLFISKLCRDRDALSEILALVKNDGEHPVQMGEAWLLCELAVFFPEEIWQYLAACGLDYAIAGTAIQKIQDSYRISSEWKARFKALRSRWKGEKLPAAAPDDEK